jgi:hypothetical protein
VHTKTKMPTPIAMLFLLFLCVPASSFANGWVLITPEFTITDAEVTPTKKWVRLDSFATVLQCNDHRSSSIRLIDKTRREIGSMEDRSAAETQRELRLLWHMYTSSKCVSSR